jgi:hypothetical protein
LRGSRGFRNQALNGGGRLVEDLLILLVVITNPLVEIEVVYVVSEIPEWGVSEIPEWGVSEIPRWRNLWSQPTK